MQIIGGCARNIVLTVPPGIGVRPTAGRARKALFDSLGGRLAGSCVLDLCAGSGALALEAASRGAVKAVLVESDPRHIRVIEENIERVRRTGVECEFDVIQASAGNVAAYIGRIPSPGVILPTLHMRSQLRCSGRFSAVRGCGSVPPERWSSGRFRTRRAASESS